jgi:hypothetical protein
MPDAAVINKSCYSIKRLGIFLMFNRQSSRITVHQFAEPHQVGAAPALGENIDAASTQALL